MTSNGSTDPGELLLLAVTRMHRVQLKVLERMETPLTLRQYRILQRIEEGHTTLSALSRIAFRSLPSMSESVELLVKRKLVSHGTSPVDRRAAELSLTPAGAAAVAAGRARLEKVMADFFETVPHSQHKAVGRLAQRMYDYAGSELTAPVSD